MRRAILIGIIALCLASEAHAQGRSLFTGDDLFAYCEKSDLACAAYVSGSVDTLLLLQFLGKQKWFCVGNEINVRKLTDLVKLWLRDHPEQRHYTAAYAVLDAIKEKFPCN